MLIASWNVNSVRTRISQIIHWINQVNPDVLCLQETKVIDESFPVQPFEQLGYSVEIYGQKSYNGVAIISKLKTDNIHRGFCINSYPDQNIEFFKDQKRLISLSVGNHQKCLSRRCTAHSYREQWSFAVLEAN